MRAWLAARQAGVSLGRDQYRAAHPDRYESAAHGKVRRNSSSVVCNS